MTVVAVPFHEERNYKRACPADWPYCELSLVDEKLLHKLAMGFGFLHRYEETDTRPCFAEAGLMSDVHSAYVIFEYAFLRGRETEMWTRPWMG